MNGFMILLFQQELPVLPSLQIAYSSQYKNSSNTQQNMLHGQLKAQTAGVSFFRQAQIAQALSNDKAKTLQKLLNIKKKNKTK